MPLAGRSMIEWSLDALRACEAVRSTIVACPPGHVHGLDGDDLDIVPGGATRAQSVANALAVVETELVAIHDAARPLLTSELVESLIARLENTPAAAGVIAAAPLTDTVKVAAATNDGFGTPEVHKASFVIEETLDRSRLWAAQTPQVFRVEALRAALDVEPERRDAATDEAMLIEAAGGMVLIHPTPGENLKVTTPLDLRIAELLLSDRLSGDSVAQ